MARIFLSYSHQDREIVDFIEPRIQNIFGLSSLWYDRSKDGLKGGENWWANIQQEIQSSEVFMFMVSDSSLASRWCIKELQEALYHRKKVIPVLLPSYNGRYPEGFPADLVSKMREIQYVVFNFEDPSMLWGAILKEMALLTRTERWLLHNQSQILSQIAELKNDRTEISQLDIDRKVLAFGYERHYELISPLNDTPMNYSGGDLVWEILHMYSTLIFACTNFDCSDIDEYPFIFPGFDKSKEIAFADYAHFILKVHKRYQEITTHNKTVDCYRPMLPIYLQMLAVWRKCDKYQLSKEDVIHITRFL